MVQAECGCMETGGFQRRIARLFELDRNLHATSPRQSIRWTLSSVLARGKDYIPGWLGITHRRRSEPTNRTFSACGAAFGFMWT